MYTDKLYKIKQRSFILVYILITRVFIFTNTNRICYMTHHSDVFDKREYSIALLGIHPIGFR